MPDILIRGMEMPKHCFNCSTKIDPDNRRCNIDGHIFEETLSKLTCRRDEDCPIRELPAHGDLIDRDNFINNCVELAGEDEELALFTKSILSIYFDKCAPVIVPSNKENKNAN